MEIPTWNSWPCQPCSLQRSKWIQTGKSRSRENWKRPNTSPCQRMMKICRPSHTFSSTNYPSIQLWLENLSHFTSSLLIRQSVFSNFAHFRQHFNCEVWKYKNAAPDKYSKKLYYANISMALLYVHINAFSSIQIQVNWGIIRLECFAIKMKTQPAEFNFRLLSVLLHENAHGIFFPNRNVNGRRPILGLYFKLEHITTRRGGSI